MGHIFVSYPHSDSAFVNKLVNDLLDDGYDVWQDALNLAGGVEWESELMTAIDDCEIFLLVWTANMEGSAFSKKEKDRAIRGGKTIIPVLYSGDPDRMWDDIQKYQWINFREGNYNDGWKALTRHEEIDLPRVENAPPGLSETIREGDLSMEGAKRLWRTTIQYRIDKKDYTGLLIERSASGIQSYLVTRNDTMLNAPKEIQVFMNFSGVVNKDRFEDYLEYAVHHHDPVWTILLRGPINSTNRGLEYLMSDSESAYKDAVHVAWNAIGRVGGSERTPVHLYMNAPVALGAAFCANEHFRFPLHIYQLTYPFQTPAPTDKNRYFKAYSL